MTTNKPADDRSAVALAAWERPAMVRLDASDAEMMNGAFADMMAANMQNS